MLQLTTLIKHLNIQEGNIKILILNQSPYPIYCYQIKHSYPTSFEYKYGVKLSTWPFERNNPAVKQYSADYKNKVARFKENEKIYEALLENKQGAITEGSQSNIFFIRNYKLYTAPGHMVLNGITRDKTIEISKTLEVSLTFEPVLTCDLKTFDAAFLTGTSPKILPVKQINNVIFDPDHRLALKLMPAYDELIDSYIQSVK